MNYALILHAHLPYVRPDGPEILEERWLYEAVAETYLPLLWALERLARDGVPARLAISLSGPLLSMLGDTGLMSRCRRHLTHTLDLAGRQVKMYAGTPLEQAAAFHRDRFAQLVADFDRRGGNLIAGFAALADAGLVELFTAAGSHGYLPLLATDRGRSAQIEAGLQEFARHFGRRPAGIWLPECAYAPGLDHLLRAAGIRWFVAEAATVAGAWPTVPAGTACVRTPGGVAAFARDKEAARLVWDSSAGYPGDPAYREFYRDEGFDLPLEEVAPWLVEGSVRSDTGVKLYRVEGAWGEKLPYDPAAALARAAEHARHYAGVLARRDGLVVTPFDAELFGHWWFEGPAWIEALFRELAALAGDVRPVSPSDWLSEPGAAPPLVRLPSGSWGSNADHGFWLSPATDFLWPRLHDAELRMLQIAEADALPRPVIDQAARELLLAQASDWPFILAGGTTAAYAQRRAETHLERFDALVSGRLDPADVDAEDGLFPLLDGRALYAPLGTGIAPVPEGSALRILMLSWEFPPGNVGGLGRHVCDLGEALAELGHTVHVVTLADDTCGPGFSHEQGMTVHRVERPPEEGEFLSWVYRYNLAMVAAAEEAGPFDVVHCHDWLVGQAGMALQACWGVPLVATVHATERGRNNGIQSPVQAAIHDEEWQLVLAADAVITVSQAMGREVADSFRATPTVIYNGVKLPTPAGPPPLSLDGPYFFFIGRLVAEKGVQVAIQALARLPERAHLVVAGKGPMEAQLRLLVAALGVTDRVHFLGRVADADKDAWLQHAVAGLVPSLYEPFGITALEIMCAGTPVVVGDTGGLAEIVTHGADGLKVPPGDVAALAQTLSGLLADPDSAARLGAVGRNTAAERFAWPAIAARTMAVYLGTFRAGPKERAWEECP